MVSRTGLSVMFVRPSTVLFYNLSRKDEGFAIYRQERGLQ